MCGPTFHYQQIIQRRFDLAQMNVKIIETADLISKAGYDEVFCGTPQPTSQGSMASYATKEEDALV